MIKIPTINLHTSVAGLSAELQMFLDSFAKAFPDVFEAREVEADEPDPVPSVPEPVSEVTPDVVPATTPDTTPAPVDPANPASDAAPSDTTPADTTSTPTPDAQPAPESVDTTPAPQA